MTTKITNDYRQQPASGHKPKQIIVLLHGYGSSGRDLISLAPYWAAGVPEAVFISPDAPFPCEMSPMSGFQWFSLQDRDPQVMLREVKTAAPILDEYLDGLLSEYNLSDENLALVGFSQGTMMSLYSAPRRKAQIAGVLGYSGALIGADDLADKNKPPLCLIHGENDSVVPVAAYHHAHEILTQNGFSLTGHTTPHLEHSIDEKGIEAGQNFLRDILS